MGALPLNSGAYSSTAYALNAQRCVNLYPESAPQETTPAVPVVHMLAPGLKVALVFPDAAMVRCVYTASNGDLYAVCGSSVYYVQANTQGAYSYTYVGSVTQGTGLVRMADNGQDILIVDGSAVGYSIDLTSRRMSGISAAANSGTNGFAYSGADWVDFVDTFLFGNTPGTSNWFASASNTLAFDPLSYGSKSGLKDTILATVVAKRNIWLIGTQATELWYNVGGANFPFGLFAGPYMEHGAVGKYAITRCGAAIAWLARDKNGKGFALVGEDYSARIMSTRALEGEWQNASVYGDLSDTVAFSFQLNGHFFAVFRFPTADKTWILDILSGQWHERETQDTSGVPHQWRVTCATAAYGVVFGGDWENGTLYLIDPRATTDAGVPITRRRSWPHQASELRRITDWLFKADIQVGAALDVPSLATALVALDYDAVSGDGQLAADPSISPLYLDPIPSTDPYERAGPLVNLRYSDTRGASWHPYIARNLGPQGVYRTLVQWTRLGLARDRVYEISWNSTQITALLGAWMDRQGNRS